MDYCDGDFEDGSNSWKSAHLLTKHRCESLKEPEFFHRLMEDKKYQIGASTKISSYQGGNKRIKHSLPNHLSRSENYFRQKNCFENFNLSPSERLLSTKVLMATKYNDKANHFTKYFYES